MNPILLNKDFNKKISFFTLVTRFDEYQEMVESAKKAGFNRSDIEFFYFDNKNSNEFDGYSGINHALKVCDAKYLIFCHQDILFEFDGYQKLVDCIDELNQKDSLWAVAGNAGKDFNGHFKVKITDPNADNQTRGPFPAKVMSLDENFLIINTAKNVSCSYDLKGFHLYGLDICTNAISLGLNCYVVDFHLKHKSAGGIDQSFFDSRKHFITKQLIRSNRTFFSTTCTNFYVGSSALLSWIMNSKVIIKLYTFWRR